MSLRCDFGIHNREWEYRHSRTCEQIGRCTRCGNTKNRIVHREWTDYFYKYEKSCYAERECTCCKEVESKKIHIWSKWYYQDHGTCETFRMCERCEERETGIESHQYGHEKFYYMPDNCFVYIACKRCDYKMLIGQEHQWVILNSNGDRMCQRCKERD